MAALVHPLAQNDAALNEWTIMVFFAGNKDLSPSMTSQLKAIKDAGFQKKTTVLIHFDPNERGAGTMTFEVNRQRKLERGTIIGDGKDPFVRNLIEDSILGAPRAANASDALRIFLDIGARNHPAKHYMVFLVGHGVVVGNDAFLPDHQPETAISLHDLGRILHNFADGVDMRGGAVELIGLHSCSMSAIEVAYELKGSAKYMMATEGVSFVGSWPYRQLLKKILKTIDDDGEAIDVDKLILSVQRLSLHNSTDFMFSGLSADLSLSRLNQESVETMTNPIKRLAKALKEGLKTPRGLELISLAHLKAQSFWQETYSDLYDFCLCLEEKCEKGNAVQWEMKEASEAVRSKLEESAKPGSFIVESDYFGPLFQYSHGMSIFFPWASPSPDLALNPAEDILGRYRKYKFTSELGDDSWLSFLEQYFKATLRKSREAEDGVVVNQPQPVTAQSTIAPGSNGAFVAATNGNGVDSLAPDKVSPALKRSPPLEGDSCFCSVKNYPMEFLQSARVTENANPEVQGARSAFELAEEAIAKAFV